MPNLNRVTLMGNLTRDPEVKYTPKGTSVCQFGLAINSTYVKDGVKKTEVTFLDIEAWGNTADAIAKHLTKGQPIYVEGRLKTETWDDKQTGQKRHKLKVVLESFQFLSSRESGNDEQDEAPRPQVQREPSRQPAQRPKPTADPDLDVEPDEIPFSVMFPILIPSIAALQLLF